VIKRIKTTRWSKFNRPLVYRLTCDPDPHYAVLQMVFGFREELYRSSREAIVDDFGDLVILPNYQEIFKHIIQEH
jgi:hypothetical protein